VAGGIREQERTPNIRKRRSIVYIVCEGKETEVNYFKRFQTRYSTIDIRPISSQHKAAIHLVSHAKDQIKQKAFSAADGDEIWCVFDRDSNTNDDLQKAENLAAKHSFHIAFSNPAFELWFLLHFIEQRGPLSDCDAIIKKLDTDGVLKGYGKSKDYYDRLLSSQPQAIERALDLIALHTNNNTHLIHRDSNPCTTVVHLVEMLNERKKQTR